MQKKKIITDIITTIIIVSLVTALFVVVYLSPKDQSIKASAPIYQGNNGITLTFNVYQQTEIALKISEILTSYGVSATFFLGGCWVNKNVDATKTISQNHEIGSHGYYHYDHAKMSEEENEKEILKSIELIEGVTDKKIKLFAPPSGSYGEECLNACKKLGLLVTTWSKDTIDWRDQDVELIKTRALSNLKQGDIILMHPTPATLIALPEIIEGILAKGFKITTLSENYGL